MTTLKELLEQREEGKEILLRDNKTLGTPFRPAAIDTLEDLRACLKANNHDTSMGIGIIGEVLDVTDLDSWDVPKLRPHIARSLSMINRYAGHTAFPYSVATHSCILMYLAFEVHKITEPQQLYHVLMHDAAEAIIGDIIRPIKRTLPKAVKALEDAALEKLVGTVAGAPSEELRTHLHTWDTRLAATEALILQNHDILPNIEKYGASEMTDWIAPLPWNKAAHIFSNMEHLLRQRIERTRNGRTLRNDEQFCDDLMTALYVDFRRFSSSEW